MISCTVVSQIVHCIMFLSSSVNLCFRPLPSSLNLSVTLVFEATVRFMFHLARQRQDTGTEICYITRKLPTAKLREMTCKI